MIMKSSPPRGSLAAPAFSSARETSPTLTTQPCVPAASTRMGPARAPAPRCAPSFLSAKARAAGRRRWLGERSLCAPPAHPPQGAKRPVESATVCPGLPQPLPRSELPVRAWCMCVAAAVVAVPSAPRAASLCSPLTGADRLLMLAPLSAGCPLEPRHGQDGRDAAPCVRPSAPFSDALSCWLNGAAVCESRQGRGRAAED